MCFIEKKIFNIIPPFYGLLWGGGGGNVDYFFILNYFMIVFL